MLDKVGVVVLRIETDELFVLLTYSFVPTRVPFLGASQTGIVFVTVSVFVSKNDTESSSALVT